jgi:ribosomal-protein-alanine N-acetyltransferase
MLQISFDPFPLIETERLLLRRLTLADLPSLLALRSDKTIMKKLDKVPEAMHEVMIYFNKIDGGIESNTAICWGIFLRETGIHIGNIGYHNIYKEHYRAEIGYVLLPAFQEKGFMTECMEPVISYGFQKMGLRTIEARINPSNTASEKVLLKTGFEREGYFKQSYFFGGEFQDTAVFSLVNPG